MGRGGVRRARADDKPILLSVGYSACHWCHVMERESFENAETAKLMNEHFVSVKVDREERPDVDAIYMEAVVAISGSGGWPLTVFLKPDGEPFFGGTYFPPTPRHGLRAFRELLQTIAGVWRDKREETEKSSKTLVEHLRRSAEVKPPEGGGELAEGLIYGALENLMGGFDFEWGGWGGAPKFPPASALEFLMRLDARDLVEKTLDSMALGGMYDLVGGGFHRYSVDERWLVPHFEKMLYDNALLAVSYLHGWQTLGKERYRQVAEQTVEYMLRELSLDGGGLASAQDADTDGEEGLTFTWKRDGEVPDQFLHIFERDRFIVRGELDEELRARLLATRDERPQPGRDDKAIASWNGLALAALAECGRVLERPEWIDAGRRLATSAQGALDGVRPPLPHVARRRCQGHRLSRGLRRCRERSLRAARRDGRHPLPRGVESARAARRRALRRSRERRLLPDPGRRRAARRPQEDFDDHPAPSGNSMLAYVLIRLARIYGDDELAERAASFFRLIPYALMQAPSSFGWALVALDLYLSPPREHAIVGPADSDVARAALAKWDPKAVVAFGPGRRRAAARREDARRRQGPPLYVCERFACQAPVTDPAKL